MINQIYNAEITPNEYVMRGNSAIIKCLIPSFVADFVQVVAWINEEGEEFKIETDFSDGNKVWKFSSSRVPFLDVLGIFIYFFEK